MPVVRHAKQKANKRIGKMTKHTKSLGKLRLATKTKDQSPDMTGRIIILRETLITLVKQLQESGLDEVEANLAAWVNTDPLGRYLGLEISPLFGRAKKPAAAEYIADLLGASRETAVSEGSGSQREIEPRSDRSFQ
jgi:hypothetical protein